MYRAILWTDVKPNTRPLEMVLTSGA